MADYQINTLLDETKAVLVIHEAVANEADRKLVRRWDRIPNQFLNGLESDVRARRKETDPKADVKTFAGTWRIVTVEIERGKTDTNGGALIETLAFGFQTALTESEARTVQITGEPANAGFTLTRAWVYVDPNAADTLVATLNAVTTVVDPKGDDQTYSGTFAAGQVLQTENQDGSVTITQTLSKVTAIPNFATLYALAPSEKRSTKEQVHPFDSDGDYLVYTVNQTVTREIQTFKHLYSEYRSTIDAITPTQFTALAPSGFAFVNKDLKEEQDGSLTLDVVFQDITDKDIYVAQTVENAPLLTVATQLYLEQGNDTPLSTASDIGQGAIVTSRVTRREDGRFDKEKQVETSVALEAQFRSQSSLFREENEILYSNSRDKITAPPATGSGIYRVEQRQNKDGTYSGSLVYEYGLATGEVRWDSQNSSLQNSDTVLYKDWNDKINSPSSVQGAVYNVTNSLTDRGTYDARLVYDESIADTVRFRQSSTRFRDGQAILYENSRDALVAPTATGSGIYQVNQRLNPDGTYTGTLTYEYGTNTGSAEFASNEAVLATADTIIYKDINTQVVSPAAALGGIYNVTNTLTERGTYDARLVYEASIAANTEFRSRSTRFVTGNSIAYDNWRTKIEAPTATGSGVYTVSQRVNQDGTYSGQLDYQSGTNAGEAVATVRQSTLSTDKEILYKSRASQVDAPTSAVGAVYDVSNTLGDDGLYDARLVYQESTAKNVAFVANTAAQRTRSSLTYENSRSVIEAPTLTVGNGGIYETAQRLNEDGTYSGTVTYQQSAAATVQFGNVRTRFRSGKEVLYENSRTQIDVPAAVAGSGVYRAAQRLNEDGTYSGSLTYEEGLNTGEASFLARRSELSTDTEWIYKSRSEQIDAPTSVQAGVYDVTNTLGDDGLYDARLVYQGSIAKTAEFSDSESVLSDGRTILYENSTTAITAPPNPIGGVYQASQRLNEDGTYSGSLVYQESAAKTTEFMSRITAFRDASTIQYDNSRTKIEPPSAVTGSGVYSVTQRVNADGTYSGQLVYEDGLNTGEAVARSKIAALAANTEVLYKSRTNQVDAPATVAQGSTYDVRNALGDDGLYDASLLYQSSIAANAQFVSSLTQFRSGNTIVYENSRTKIEPPTSVSGPGVYSVTQRINEDGTYSGQLDYQSGTNEGEAVATVRQSTLSTDKEILYKSRASQVDAPTSAVGAVYDVSNTLGDDGLYDARLVYQESTAKNVAFVANTAAQRTRSSLTYENSRSVIEAPTLTAGNGGIYETAQRINEDGTYSGNVTYQQSTADRIDFDSLKTRFVTGKTIQYENNRTFITAPPATGSGIYRVSQRENEDGTYSGSLVYENGSDTGDAIFDSKKAELATAVTRIYRDVTNQINAPPSGQGAVYNATNTLTERGTYDARLVYDASVAKTVSARVRATLFNEANALIYENSRLVIEAEPATGSGLYSVTQRMNEDGTYSGQLVYENGLNAGHAVFVSRDSTLSADKEVLYKNRTTQVDAPTSAPGAIYDVANSLGENGLYDAKLIYQKSNDATVYFVSSNGPFNQTSEILYENVLEVIGAPDSDFGIYRVSQRLNEDGTYSGSLTYSTSDNSAYAEFPSERSTLRSEDTILYRDRNEVVVAGTAGQSGVYAASNSLNDRGLYDGRLVYQTSNVKGVYFVASQTPFEKTSEILYENSLTQLGAPSTTAGVYRVAQRLNLDGTYSGSLTYNETVAGGEARVVARNSTLRNDIDVIYKSKATPVPAETSAQGYIYDVSNELRQDGLYDARLVYQVNQPFSIGFSSVEGLTDASQTILYENNALKIDPPAGVDGLYTANQRVNEDGTYSGTLVYSKGIPVEMYKTWQSNNRTVGQWIYLNQETVNIPSVSVYNANSFSGLQYKNDGTYDFAFTSVNDDTVAGTTPIASGYTDQIYMYARHARVFMYWNQAWTHSRSEAHDFAEGTSALIFGTKTAGTTIVNAVEEKRTNWDRSGNIWHATRVEVL